MIDEAERGHSSNTSGHSIPSVIATATAVVVDPNTQRIASIKAEVNSKITQFEASERARYEDGPSSVCYLYGHWFSSVLCLFECSFHLMILFIVCFVYLLVASIFFYIILVFSCGKVSINYCENVSHYLKMLGIYSGIWMGLLCNIIVPWAPALYLWKKGQKIERPSGYKSPYDPYHNNQGGCCCSAMLCCFGNVNINPGQPGMPLWLTLQSCLMSIGCCNFCGSLYCGAAAYATGIKSLCENEARVVVANTQNFYQVNYGASSLDELIAREIGY